MNSVRCVVNPRGGSWHQPVAVAPTIGHSPAAEPLRTSRTTKTRFAASRAGCSGVLTGSVLCFRMICRAHCIWCGYLRRFTSMALAKFKSVPTSNTSVTPTAVLLPCTHFTAGVCRPLAPMWVSLGAGMRQSVHRKPCNADECQSRCTEMCAAAGLAVGAVTDHDLRVSILGAANDAAAD